MPSVVPKVDFDEHLARLLLLTLLITLLLTGFSVLGEMFLAALLATCLLVLYTAVQGFRYGYLEGKLTAVRSRRSSR